MKQQIKLKMDENKQFLSTVYMAHLGDEESRFIIAGVLKELKEDSPMEYELLRILLKDTQEFIENIKYN